MLIARTLRETITYGPSYLLTIRKEGEWKEDWLVTVFLLKWNQALQMIISHLQFKLHNSIMFMNKLMKPNPILKKIFRICFYAFIHK